ncbi:hypothetical protein Q1695_015876 [Nippostrongylus brasiliensis]|nr:hypothetical protein Q1695_015876 [Nippostrongylus brasiliensis]
MRSITFLLLFSSVFAKMQKATRKPPTLKCNPQVGNLSPFVQAEQEELYQNFHRNMNLKFDCGIMRQAFDAAKGIMNGGLPRINDNLCGYTRMYYDALNWVMSVSHAGTSGLPLEKIMHTAILHPNTTYGCAYDFHYVFLGTYYSIVCLYKKIEPEDRCFCNVGRNFLH